MKEIKIESYSDYINIVEKYKGNALFRGQANSEWEVVPNIFRDQSKLENETKYINKSGNESNLEILSHILELQHYGNGTRLCDLTINPLVALYFCIENSLNDNSDAAVYIFNKDSNIDITSIELKILLILTTNELKSVQELKNMVFEHTGVNIGVQELTNIICENYIIDHDINLSYTNNRATLQGGTGLFFGFDIEEGNIMRKNSKKLESIVMKIVVPCKLKKEIRNNLSNFGINKQVLYDDITQQYKMIKYSTEEKIDKAKFSFKKVIIDVKVSDVLFTIKDIENIVENVFSNAKSKFGPNSRIFIYVYYDDEDKRIGNWISRPTNHSEFNSYNLNYNCDYFTRRMININKEISIKTILEKTEPIVILCEKELNKIIKSNNDMISNIANYNDYLNQLIESNKKLEMVVLYDLQDISHGRSLYDEYYENSWLYCDSVNHLINEQIINIQNGSNILYLKDNYNWLLKNCKSNYDKYQSSKLSILKMQANINKIEEI